MIGSRLKSKFCKLKAIFLHLSETNKTRAVISMNCLLHALKDLSDIFLAMPCSAFFGVD